MYIVEPFFSRNKKRIQQEQKKQKEEEIASYIDDICKRQAEKSNYYFTYDDIIRYFKGDVSYTDVYKFMPKFIENNEEYLRLGFPNEAHFVHLDYLKQYNEISLPQWKAYKSIEKQRKHTADIRGWTNSPIHIDKLQLKLDPSAVKSIGKRFYQNNIKHKKPSSDSVVFQHENGADIYKFVSYPNGSLTIHVSLFNSIEVHIDSMKTFFDFIRKIIIRYCGYYVDIQIPFSFITNQVYPLYKSFDRSKSYYRAKPFTQLSLTLYPLIRYLTNRK